MSVKFLLDYSTKPLQLFGVAGLLCLAAEAASGSGSSSRKAILNEGLIANHGPLLLLGMALVMGGIQFIAIGLIGELAGPHVLRIAEQAGLQRARVPWPRRNQAKAGRSEPPRRRARQAANAKGFSTVLLRSFPIMNGPVSNARVSSR